jgi:hypothetical protein
MKEQLGAEYFDKAQTMNLNLPIFDQVATCQNLLIYKVI